MGQASRNVVSMVTSDTTKVNATKRSKATSKTNLVVLLVLCLLTEGYAKTTLTLPARFLCFLINRNTMFKVECKCWTVDIHYT